MSAIGSKSALGAAGMSSLGSAPGTANATSSSASLGPLAALGAGAANADSTFITRARSQLNKNSTSSNEEPLGLDRVRNLHTQLTNVVGSLNDKVSTILKKQESEFLRAYRAHMYSVQKELAQLRAKADDAALQLAKNEKIRQLEGR
jgi:hypothetical protein